jgi:hypothetical protein
VTYGTLIVHQEQQGKFFFKYTNKHAAESELYSLLRSTIMGAKNVNLLKKLANEQILPGIMGRMPPEDFMQWAKERPS